MADNTKRSSDCGGDNDLNERAQLFYEEKYFSDPLRRPDCQKAIRIPAGSKK